MKARPSSSGGAAFRVSADAPATPTVPVRNKAPSVQTSKQVLSPQTTRGIAAIKATSVTDLQRSAAAPVSSAEERTVVQALKVGVDEAVAGPTATVDADASQNA